MGENESGALDRHPNAPYNQVKHNINIPPNPFGVNENLPAVDFPPPYSINHQATPQDSSTDESTATAVGDSLLDTHCEQLHTPPDTIRGRTRRRKIAGELADNLRRAGLVRDAWAVDHCGLRFTRVSCTGCGQSRLVSLHCDNRLCPECSHRRAVILSKRWAKGLDWFRGERQSTPTFVTLTFRSTPKLLPATYYNQCRKRFFRSRFWRKYGILGGLSAIEIKTGSGSGEWHVHIHSVVLTSKAIPLILIGKHSGRFQLSVNESMAQTWETITGDSRIVDGRKIDVMNGGLVEVLKYIAKGVNLLESNQLRELVLWAKGKRMLSAWGELYANPELRAIIDEPEADQSSTGDKPCSCGCCDFVIDHFQWNPRLQEYVVMKTERVTVEPDG